MRYDQPADHDVELSCLQHVPRYLAVPCEIRFTVVARDSTG